MLPETFGICFVLVIVAGFAGAYFAADRAWCRTAPAQHRAEADTFAAGVAAALAAIGDGDPADAERLLTEVARHPRVSSLAWLDAGGQPRFTWPRQLPPALRVGPPPAEGAGARGVAEVPAGAGSASGTVHLELKPGEEHGYRERLAWTWGLAAGATLLAFGLVYVGLRRHVRAVAAIERNLDSYAAGLEAELATLALSDALGPAAAGWNRLIGELAGLQAQLALAQHAEGGAAGDMLERFEGALFRRMVDRMSLGVACVGESGQVQYINAAAAGLVGRAPDELRGRAAGELIADPQVAEAIEGARTGRGAARVIDHVQAEGEQEVALRFRVVPLAPRRGTGEVLVTVEDIAVLREGQRARDNFLYHVTHELRTPLTNINAYAETLTKPGFEDEQTRKECYNVIVSETRRLSSLVENILSISQLEVGTARLDLGEVDLLRLVRQMVQDNLGAADEKQIDLTLSLPPKVPKITGDKQRLSVLLQNLIGNAIKYTPAGGRVQVKLEVMPEAVRVAVVDNGIGIAPSDQAHVFEKFYRAASDAVQMVTGTGLGLAIAREVARLHGGEILLESELGKGASFTMELPLPAASRTEACA